MIVDVIILFSSKDTGIIKKNREIGSLKSNRFVVSDNFVSKMFKNVVC